MASVVYVVPAEGDIPRETVNGIRRAADIAAIVRQSVALTHGAAFSMWGVCPFCPSKRTALNVIPDKGIWHCFDCGDGGDVFTFVMRRDGVTFRDAVETVNATLAGGTPSR